MKIYNIKIKPAATAFVNCIRISALICLLMLSAVAMMAQEEEKAFEEIELKKLEIGINITSVLKSFVGNDATISSEDFPLLFRLHGNKMAGRLGLGFAVQNTEFFDQITFNTRQSELTSYFVKLGLERKVFQDRRLSFYWGLDLIGIYEVDKVTSPSFDNLQLVKEITTYGISPFLGFSFKLNERIRLHTESSTNLFYETSLIKEIQFDNEEIISEENALFGEIQVPIFLYLNVRF